MEVAQNDWAAERDRLRDARDAQRDRYEELKQRIDEGDEASALALEHAERRADAASAELEDRGPVIAPGPARLDTLAYLWAKRAEAPILGTFYSCFECF